MKTMRYSMFAAVLAAAMLMLTSCMGDMNDDRSSSPGDVPDDDGNGHISSTEGVISDGNDIISSVEDFISDVTSDIASDVSEAVG